MSPFTESPTLELLPAVDVADGQAVRLVQGEAGSETSYGDPLDWIFEQNLILLAALIVLGVVLLLIG